MNKIKQTVRQIVWAFGWNENNALMNNSSLAAGATQTADIDLANNSWDLVSVTFEVTFGGSPDGDFEIKVFSSSDSGSNDDTEPLYTITISFATSTTKRKTIHIPDSPYLAVQVKNLDSADSVTFDSWYAGRTPN